MLPGLKRPGRGFHNPTQSSADVEERVEISVHPLWTLVACKRLNSNFTFYLQSFYALVELIQETCDSGVVAGPFCFSGATW